MREAIERVIAELEERNMAAVERMISHPMGSSSRTQAYERLHEILDITEKLKEVLSHEEIRIDCEVRRVIRGRGC